MKVTFLGCGSSAGVPVMGFGFGACDAKNPKNNRMRSSIVIELTEPNARILIDAGPDLRQQWLRFMPHTQDIDGLILTHAHYDHCGGLDELRAFNRSMKKPVLGYAFENAIEKLRERLPYSFWDGSNRLDRVSIHYATMVPHQSFICAGHRILPIHQIHGKTYSAGIRIKDFAYSTDVSDITPEAEKNLLNLACWVVDCTEYTSIAGHFGLDAVMHWVNRLKPKQVILTHLSHHLDYDTLVTQLPKWIRPAYDGLIWVGDSL
jgi:phosphoribosyl 1,2-cyclic phosphate phosphodiesterase